MEQILKGRIHLDQNLTYVFFEIYVIKKVMTSQKVYDVIPF